MLYIETSALLAVLFREPNHEPIRDMIEDPLTKCTSALTFAEANRAISRALFANALSERAAQALRGQLALFESSWIVLAVTDSVLTRAGGAFPVEPVQTLDAVHLASALEFSVADPDLSLVAFDRRVADNVEPLGLSSP